jgi:dTDP-4-dehydrorhamnose reductase
MVVLVTGATGQLGQSLQFIAPKFLEIDFVFCSSADLDITNLESCQAVFSGNTMIENAIIKSKEFEDPEFLKNNFFESYCLDSFCINNNHSLLIK